MLDIAKQAAKEGGKVALKHLDEKHELHIKGEVSDFATEADLEAEKVILEIIKSKYPDHNIISEEKGRENNNSDFTWVVDPIDGTIMYASKLPTFSISVGLFKNNQPHIGAIYIPLLDELIGSDSNLKVSKTEKLENAVVGFDFGYAMGRNIEIDKYLKLFAEKVRYTSAFGSVAFALAKVATGQLSAYVHKAKVWDFAAGAAIVEAAGGKVTDAKGNPVDWTKEEIEVVATNGLIHDQIIQVLITNH